MDIRYMCTSRGLEEYVLVDGKRYNCLKKAKDEASKYRPYGRGYVEGMEYLAWKVFVRRSVKNEGLFEEE